ncbi:heme ABC exporter ATP-binding protein CcmA [Methylocystis iwaonis]|uniref:Cytochrome c biogenesis ATP-binding export protein CcmA n=1 Tax=Methylocystis iwaonis TaxID=2885079 RepID=A0ABM8EDD2_9HYPH|nr:heme ABC exporter ATP-binding protein CcmA [Methylocystis iwaonis]BDV35919.1 cytochrome c biogenesis ATP-binding export protein CcmA [Methylocystis iwaonis]
MEKSPHRPHADVQSALRLSVENLAVSRGGRPVLAGVSFALSGGEALVVTGRNGAGKSTLLRTLAGLLPRAAGEMRLEGAGEEAELPQQAHYLAHADGMKAALSLEENLEFWSFYLSPAADPRARTIAEALAVVGLSFASRAPFGALSAGQKRRAALARLLVAFRPVWLLDEPLTALDKVSREKFAAVMRDHCAKGGLIVAATHEPLGLEEAGELALGGAK